MGDDPSDSSEATIHDMLTDDDFGYDELGDFRPGSFNPEDQCLCGSARCQEMVLSSDLDRALCTVRIVRTIERGFFLPTLDRIWPILTRGQTDRASYLAQLAEYYPDRHCGQVWPPGSFAFRCRTCGNTPIMALCGDCFKYGNHADHDYELFKSRSGGACDCGMDTMVKEFGHCIKHGQNAVAKRAHESIPAELICIPRRSMPRLIHRVLMSLRRGIGEISVADELIENLGQIANSSPILRELMAETLINENVYTNQMHFMSNHPNKLVAQTIVDGLKNLKRYKKSWTKIKLPAKWNPPQINAFMEDNKFKCFLEELVFFTVAYEYPQKLVCFLLGFQMHKRYKEVFARAFVGYYPVMIMAAAKDKPRRHFRDSYEQSSRKIQQISSQLYNDPELTNILCDKEHSLHTLIYCLRLAIEGAPSSGLRGVLKDNPLCPISSSGSTPKIVSYDNVIIKDSHLNLFTQDLNVILDFEEEVKSLIGSKDLLNIWLETLGYFQSMSPYKRAEQEHAPYEPGPQVSLFTIESEFCLSPLWSMLKHFKTAASANYTNCLLQSIHAHLLIWFHRMGIGPDSLLDPYRMSFHIPLHRMFSAIIRHLLYKQSRPETEIHEILGTNLTILGKKYGYKSGYGAPRSLTMDDFCRMLLLHPIQVLGVCNETRCNMWIRNGLMLAHQAVTYVHCAYCYSTIDLDMFLVRYCAAKLNPNYFLHAILSKFHAWKWFGFNSDALMSDPRRNYYFRILPEQIEQMVDSSLMVIIQLLTLSIYCNISERDQAKQELVALLSVRDRSYSYLTDMLPERSLHHIDTVDSNDSNLESLLKEMAIYKPAQHGSGGNLQQGSYTLKLDVWLEEYDPLQVLYRFNQKRDYQISLERFYQVCKNAGKLDRHCHQSSLWPPFKIPKNIGNFGQLDLSPLLECPTLAGIVYSTLNKSLYIDEVPDAVMAYVIFLLELALRKCTKRDHARNDEAAAPKLNSSFIGRCSYNELVPESFGPCVDAYLKGSAIYACPSKEARNLSVKTDSCPTVSPKIFPSVQHALDLAFDSTWFPFSSLIDNSIVHIDYVHSISMAEFKAMLRDQRHSGDAPGSSTSSPSGSKSKDFKSCSRTGSSLSADDDEEFSELYGDADDMAWTREEMNAFVHEHATTDDEGEDDVDDDDTDEEDDDDDDDDDDDEEDVDVEDPTDVLLTDDEVDGAMGYIPDAHMYPVTMTLDEPPFLHQRPASQPPEITVPLESEHGTVTDYSNHTMPERQSTALSLVPVLQRGGSTDWTPTAPGRLQQYQQPTAEQTAQVYPENLVTMPRAILASDPRPMIASPVQPLALEAPSGEPDDALSLRQPASVVPSIRVGCPRANTSDGSGGGGSRSLADIHARFTGFFRGDTQRPCSNPYRIGLRTRQTARRGGYRGAPSAGSAVGGHPLPPFAVHNPNNAVQQPAAQTRPWPQPLVLSANIDRGDSGAELNRFYFGDQQQPQPQAPQRPPQPGSPHPTPLAVIYNSMDDPRLALRSHADRRRSSSAASLDSATPAAAPEEQRQAERQLGERNRDHFGPMPRQTARRSHACTLLNQVLSSARASGREHQQHLEQSSEFKRSSKFERNCRGRTRKDKMIHGESLLSLLLRLHAKYSQRRRSYVYNEARARANSSMSERSRLGDGTHFVTIVLDLLCSLDRTMIARVEQLKNLIWGDKELESRKRAEDAAAAEAPESASVKRDDIGTGAAANKTNPLGADLMRSSQRQHQSDGGLSGPVAGNSSFASGEMWPPSPQQPAAGGSASASSTPSASALSPAERKRRAKEFQRKLMAEFANKQKVFLEKYESSGKAHCLKTSGRSDKSEPISSGAACMRASSAAACGDEEPINLSSKLTKPTQPPPPPQPQMTMSDLDKQQAKQEAASATQKQQLTGSAPSSSVDKTRGDDDVKTAPGNATTTTTTTDSGHPPVYECCICGVEGPSDLANPLGQVVLLQSTSILGHSHLRPQSARHLPCDESHHLTLREETYAKYLERRIDLLCEHFSESSWLDSINIGAEGGVHVQSCGHYLHIECHQSYIKSLDQERPRFRNDSDEFLCPVCRQLANSVLPILASDLRRGGQQLALVDGANLDEQIKLIGSRLERRLPPDQKELQSSAAFCSHLTKATAPQYRLVRSSASMHSLFLFLTSIARTNLEAELIIRSSPSPLHRRHCNSADRKPARLAAPTSSRGASSSSAPTGGGANDKRSCFILLFHVLALNAQTLINDQWFTCDQIWSHLTHRIDERNRLGVKPTNSEVPMLLRDPTAMLLQFLFAIAHSLAYQANFTCLVKILFNLTAIQSIALVLSYLSRDELAALALAQSDARQDDDDEFCRLLALVSQHLAPLLAKTHEEPLMNSSVRNCWSRFGWQASSNRRLSAGAECTDAMDATEEEDEEVRPREESSTPPISFVENRVKLACLPFMRAAASLQHHLYARGEWPELKITTDELLTSGVAIESDFASLAEYLALDGDASHGQLDGERAARKLVRPQRARQDDENDKDDEDEKDDGHDAAACKRLVCALNWPRGDAENGAARLVASWSSELLKFGAEFSIAARSLLVCRALAWFRPSLMRLPRHFDDVFMFYYRKKCSLCNQVPRDVAVCLVCGAPICFRVSCCKDRSRSRLVHSQHCGANTAVFLAVHTSSIVVIRGNRACVWGSVYLDAHGEEDNGLHRGKPLYLVPGRFELLERQWLTHSFDHRYSKPWIYLQENQ